MTPNSQLRARAREQLGNGIFQSTWLLALVVCLVYSALFSIGSSFVLGAVLVEGLLYGALCGIFLSLARRKTDKVIIEDLFKLDKNVGEGLLLALMKTVFLCLWSLLFVFPAIIKKYSYSMAFYIKRDHPDYDWKRCLDESRVLMNGYKWKLFCLDFSFIGWIILGSLVFGIGLLWVTPYMEAAHANFYVDLVDKESATIEGTVE